MTSTRLILCRCLWTVLLMAAFAPGTLSAQTIEGEPTDLSFTVINATTGEPGTVDRMTIEYVRNRRNGIIDFEPAGSDFTAPAVPVKEAGQYIVTVWYQEVPYWWSIRGRNLIGQTTTLHVFDTTTALAGVAVKGLNLVLRRQGTLLNLEYLLSVENASTPQHTVIDRVATFELDFPAGAEQIDAVYRRGPDPTPFAAKTHGSNRLSLAVPLTPGSNQIQVKAVVPWREGLVLPVGSNLAVETWSVLASPEWLEIRAMELRDGANDTPGYKRLTGPALEAGRDLELQLFSGEQTEAPTGDLFGQDSTAAATADAESGAESESERGFPSTLVFLGFVIIIVVAVVARRRG